jgi:hypothetical protein
MSIASGSIGANDVGAGAVLSGHIGSGQLGPVHFANGGVASGDLASGSVSWAHLATLAVRSGHVGSGAILGGLGAVPQIASGTVGPLDIGSGAVNSGHLASGQVGNNALANNSVRSGALGSGQVSTPHFASGANAMTAWMPTAEMISGLKAVCVLANNTLALAMAGSGLRMPAVGLVLGNVASGDPAQVTFGGFVMSPTSGLAETWSGMAGRPLLVGSGGVVGTFSGLLSGAAYQRIGVAVSGGLFLQPSPDVTSGAVGSPVGVV